ncbi:hypothetical protein MHB77_30630 [Paenibacillus sp. FSL K6-3166]|uniref:hypothetical protein n=1 Tax=Paenibacillus sp. FSL K6-3166 TaxID=2921492 RepID=UPI0030FC570F
MKRHNLFTLPLQVIFIAVVAVISNKYGFSHYETTIAVLLAVITATLLEILFELKNKNK